ncbi:hypothetical protein PMAYCL1PPCAC_22071, partial [Pristionchus mayeri]
LGEPRTPLFRTVSLFDHRFQTYTTFTVPRRYTNLKFINGGSRGTLVSSDDTEKRAHVAIMKLNPVLSEHREAQTFYRELILRKSIVHPNVVQTLSVFTPQSILDDFQDIYIVMTLMQYDLETVIYKTRSDHKTLSFLIYQILCAVNHLHREGVILRLWSQRRLFTEVAQLWARNRLQGRKE